MKFRTSQVLVPTSLATAVMDKLENKHLFSKESLDFNKPMRMDHTMYLLFEIPTTMTPKNDTHSREFTNG